MLCSCTINTFSLISNVPENCASYSCIATFRASAEVIKKSGHEVLSGNYLEFSVSNSFYGFIENKRPRGHNKEGCFDCKLIQQQLIKLVSLSVFL